MISRCRCICGCRCRCECCTTDVACAPLLHCHLASRVPPPRIFRQLGLAFSPRCISKHSSSCSSQFTFFFLFLPFSHTHYALAPPPKKLVSSIAPFSLRFLFALECIVHVGQITVLHAWNFPWMLLSFNPIAMSAPASAPIRAKSPASSGRSNTNNAYPKNMPLRKFFAATAVAAVAVLLLLLLNLAYLYGSVYHQTERGAAFHILLVDYDGEVVGRSLSSAYQHLKSPSFPTLFTQPPSQYPTSDTIIHAVRNRQYWAAIFTSPGASQKLSAALQGGPAATTYNSTDALTYVWNEVRYPATADSVIERSFALLVAATRVAYNSINGTQALTTLAQNDPAAVQVYLDPIDAGSINVNSMPQGAKVFYNTISMAMPILQQFFFILALNGMSARFRLYDDLPPKTSGAVRAAVSAVYTFVGALCMTGYIWAFRENWPVHGYQFMETWMVLWLLMHIYFCIIDAAASILPQPALPFFIVTWIFLNISATISPFEITPGFYRWGYALPAYSTYEILTYIWSDGPAPELHRALPILFAWWLLGLACAILAHRRRCRLTLNAAGSQSSSSKAEKAFRVEEQNPKRMGVSSSEEKSINAAEEPALGEPKQQPGNERCSNTQERDTRTAEAIASSEPEQRPDGPDNTLQTAEATSATREGKS